MKKLLALLLTVALLLGTASLAAAETPKGVVKVHAISDMGIYHQIVAIVVEYDAEVAVPDADAYTLVDFAPAYMKEDYDQRDFAEGVVTAVYTNDVADRREDKTSVPGKFVVIELKPVSGSYYDEAAGIWKPDNLFGLCTWRLAGEASEWFRNDYTAMVVSQKKAVVNAAGDTVAKAGALPFSKAAGADGWLYVSGQVPRAADGEIVSGSMTVQARAALNNLKAALALAGYGLEDVVRVNVFIDDPRDFAQFNKVYAEFFTPEHTPARVCVQAAMMSDLRVEVDCIAYRDKA